MRNQPDDVLEIELTSRCVLQCPACSRMHDPKGKPIWDAGHLDKELLFKIADTTDYKRYIFCGCYGDAIYHPDFLEICAYWVKKEKKNLNVHDDNTSEKARVPVA